MKVQPQRTRDQRNTRIVATLGPATRDPEVLEALLRAGVDVVRLNFSHGSPFTHRETVQRIRDIAQRVGRTVTVLQDLQGPKLRIRITHQEKLKIHSGQSLILTVDPEQAEHKILLPYPELIRDIGSNQTILLRDGQIRLRVREVHPPDVHTVVEVGGELFDRSGLVLPEVEPSIPALTQKDFEDLYLGVDLGVDWIAMSFVRTPEDILLLRDTLQRAGGPHIRVMAKIERPTALEHYTEILDVADGVMVARGDLGVVLPLSEIPLVQKRLIREAREKGKPVITATQMLESMIHAPTPTRAEVTDVANAIFDGTDGVMLSAETAIGHYPVEAVKVMDQIARSVENSLEFKESQIQKRPRPEPTGPDAIAYAAVDVAEALPAHLIVVFTSSGYTAQRVARFRPQVPILALTPSEHVVRQIRMLFGVQSMQAPTPVNTDDMTDIAIRMAVQSGLVLPGHSVVIVAGVPFGQERSTNLLRLATVPSEL